MKINSSFENSLKSTGESTRRKRSSWFHARSVQPSGKFISPETRLFLLFPLTIEPTDETNSCEFAPRSVAIETRNAHHAATPIERTRSPSFQRYRSIIRHRRRYTDDRERKIHRIAERSELHCTCSHMRSFRPRGSRSCIWTASPPSR